MATIREWFREAGITPDTLFMPPTEPDCYGIGETWSKLPHGTWAWADAPASVLDQLFNSGYGAQSVPDFFAWDEARVYYVSEYDGSTSLMFVPRNPPAKG